MMTINPSLESSMQIKTKFLTLVATAILACHLVQAAVLTESFLTGSSPANGEYTVGTLQNNNPTIPGWSGDWLGAASAFEVTGTGLSYPGLTTQGGALTTTSSNNRTGRVLADPVTNSTTGTLYLSFLMQVADVNGYRAFELHNGGFDDSTHRVFQIATGENNNQNYSVRLLNDNTNYFQQLGTRNEDVNLFVVRLDLGANNNEDSISVWMNPSNLANEASNTADYTASGFNIAFDRISVAKFTTAATATWDEIRIADTWNAAVIPEPGTFALLAVFGAATALVSLRKNRR